METVDYILPDWTLCPLFNGDETGITDYESQVLNDFLAREGLGSPHDCEELGFTWRNDLTMGGGNCHRVTFPAPREPNK